LTCSSPLFLVAQIYAPTSGLERNLLVFGCNRGSCYNTSDGVSIPRGTWRVFRSQQDEIPTSTTTTSTNTTNTTNEVTVQQLEQFNINENEETNLSEWGIGKEAEGAWGSDSAVESIANTWEKTRTEAIEHANTISLLTAKKKEASQSAIPYILSEEEEADIILFPNCFPAFDIETSLEYDNEERRRSKEKEVMVHDAYLYLMKTAAMMMDYLKMKEKHNMQRNS
jgi:hypothetical protein